MAHISTALDEAACHEIMRRYKLASKGEAINLALRKLAAEPPPYTPPTAKPLSADQIRAFEGIGWDGDLDAMRSGGGQQPPETAR